MKIHHLKTWPEPFEALARGDKTADFRKDDREFAVGDVLVLQEWDPGAISSFETQPWTVGKFTVRNLARRVTHIVRGPSFGVPEGFVVMSLKEVGDV